MTQGAASASVLVPTFNEQAHVEASIRAMLDQRFTGDIEVLVIDGGSTDRTPEIVTRLASEDPRVKLLDNPARRTPNALNVGLRHSSADYIVRMDAHAEFPPDYVARGIERLARGDVELVGGPIVAEGHGRWSRRIALARNTWLAMGGGSSQAPADEAEVDTVCWGVWRRDTLLALGGWDEGWPINQDAELAARIRRSGGRIVRLAAMSARYVPRDSLRALSRQYNRYGKFRAKTAGRHPETMRLSHVFAPGLALTVAATALPLPRRLRRSARLGLGAYGAVLAAGTARVAAAPGAHPRDVATVPLVLATMHLSWGVGYMMGCLRFGPPLQALAALARRTTTRARP